MKLPYKSLGNDLYADKVECTCPDPRWKDTDVAHLFKRKIDLTGYFDNHFFDNVNKEPHQGACECGREFVYQWFRDGVVFEWEGVK